MAIDIDWQKWADTHPLALAYHEILANFEGADSHGDSLLASKGACSLHALVRGGKIIGFAVWSCAQQGWIVRGWNSPSEDIEEAYLVLKNARWEG